MVLVSWFNRFRPLKTIYYVNEDGTMGSASSNKPLTPDQSRAVRDNFARWNSGRSMMIGPRDEVRHP